MVWRNLGLNPGFPEHWGTLYLEEGLRFVKKRINCLSLISNLNLSHSTLLLNGWHVCIHPIILSWVRFDTKPIFKWWKSGFNPVVSSGYQPKTKETNKPYYSYLPNYLAIVGVTRVIHAFPKGETAKWNTKSFRGFERRSLIRFPEKIHWCSFWRMAWH